MGLSPSPGKLWRGQIVKCKLRTTGLCDRNLFSRNKWKHEFQYIYNTSLHTSISMYKVPFWSLEYALDRINVIQHCHHKVQLSTCYITKNGMNFSSIMEKKSHSRAIWLTLSKICWLALYETSACKVVGSLLIRLVVSDKPIFRFQEYL